MLKHIVFPLDGSTYAEKALERGIVIANDTGAAVSLVVVVPSYETMAFSASRLPGAVELEEHHRKLAQEYLDQQVKALLDAGVKDVRGVLKRGEAHSEINDYAQVTEADLIVVSTRGLSAGGLSDSAATRGLTSDHAPPVFGSTALKILMTAPCPVLVIRALM